MKKTVCDVCGKKGAKVLHLSKSCGKGAELLVIENVPIISCPDCGESYLTAKTLREVENIKRNRSNFAVERNGSCCRICLKRGEIAHGQGFEKFIELIFYMVK